MSIDSDCVYNPDGTPVTWAQVAERANQSVMERGEWAGTPIPIEGLRLNLEPRYPYRLDRFEFSEAKVGEATDEPREEIHVLNSWYSHARRCDVIVYHTGDGRSKVGLLAAHTASQRMHFAVNTLGASNAWRVEAEQKALDKLRQLVKPHTWKHYLLSGSFLETSPRSGVTYLFRKLRPTLALRPSWDYGMHGMRALAALCLHPIGYYKESYAGSMCPTDDVIAHLLLMRADERRFWAKANQHATWQAQAGV